MVGWLGDWMGGWLEDPQDYKLIVLRIGLLEGWKKGRLVDWEIRRTIGLSVCW